MKGGQVQLTEISRRVVDEVMSTRIVSRLFNGAMTRAQYRTYMSDVYSYALHSAQVIALAGCRLVLSHPGLAEYLFRHANEELGHDRWAAADLRDLGMQDAEIEQIQPSPPCLRMIALEYFHATQANPVGLFGWMFVLESLGGAVGGKIASAIDASLGLKGKGTYFLGGHGEADTHHSKDLLRVITEHVKSVSDQAAFLRMVDESLALYIDILDNACQGDESVQMLVSAGDEKAVVSEVYG